MGAPGVKPGEAGFTPSARAPLTELEKELLRRGLNFYERFAQQNASTQRAAFQAAQAYYRVGLLQKALGDDSAAEAAHRKAIERFENLAKQDSSNVEYHRCLAQAYYGLSLSISDWNDATQCLERALSSYTDAIEIAPNVASLYHGRASVYLGLGNSSEHDEDWARAADVDVTDAGLQAIAAIGFSYHDRNRARSYAERALKLDPNSAQAHIAMAHSLPEGTAETLRHLSQAIALDPQLWMAYWARAGYFLARDRVEEARVDVKKALELAPDDISVLAIAAALSVRLNAYDEAEQYLERALQLEPNRATLLAQYGDLRLTQRRYAEAVEKLTEAVTREPSWWVFGLRRLSGHVGGGPLSRRAS